MSFPFSYQAHYQFCWEVQTTEVVKCQLNSSPQANENRNPNPSLNKIRLMEHFSMFFKIRVHWITHISERNRSIDFTLRVFCVIAPNASLISEKSKNFTRHNYLPIFDQKIRQIWIVPLWPKWGWVLALRCRHNFCGTSVYHGYDHWLCSKETNGRSQALTERATRAMRLGISCSFPGYQRWSSLKRGEKNVFQMSRIIRSSLRCVARSGIKSTWVLRWMFCYVLQCFPLLLKQIKNDGDQNTFWTDSLPGKVVQL